MKDSTVIWFTSLEGNNIITSDQMKNTFSEKYRDYCKARDTQDEIFI